MCRVFYWSEEDKKRGREGTMAVFKTPGEERKYGRGPNLNAVCLIHDNLQVRTGSGGLPMAVVYN